VWPWFGGLRHGVLHQVDAVTIALPINPQITDRSRSTVLQNTDPDSCFAGQEIPLMVQNRSVFLTQYWSGDKIEKNELGRACSAYGGKERRIQGFGRET
jgi:hypothetical protein